LKEFAEYTSDANDKNQLLTMTSNTDEGRELYNSFIVKGCRHVTHILEDLPSCKPAIDHLLELLPRLQPRFYSISSSPKMHKDSVHVTAVVIEYQTPSGRTNKGVCTTWLQPMLPVEDTFHKVPIYVRRSQFRLPNRVQTPVIMIGPGTGVAPFRGFIQERAWHKEQGKPVGETILYFGCRHQDKDFIYRDEMEKYASDGVLTLHTAFSRDQPQKVYVTDRMREHMDNLWTMIGQKGAHIYVCGDAKMMAKDVHNIVVEVVEKGGAMSHEDAEKYVKKMEQQKRYSADVWS
jgi:NADPH-ferrihemoprotein reductase